MLPTTEAYRQRSTLHLAVRTPLKRLLDREGQVD